MAEIEDKRYRACCCCHVRTCTLVIGVLELIWCVIALISVIACYGTKWIPKHDDLFNETSNATSLPFSPAAMSGFSLFECIVGLTVVPMLIYAVLKERPVFLIPHMVLQVISLITQFAFMIIFGLGSALITGMVAAAAAHEGKEAEVAAGVTIGVFVFLLILMIITFLIQLYFLYVVVKCYRFLKEKLVSGGVDSYHGFA